MPKDMIGAEVIPQPGKSVEAAKGLQDLGFKVLHIGKTSISVQGSPSLWEETFSITLETRSKSTRSSSGSKDVPYRWPLEDPVPIPIPLKELITSVAFVEPPEFF